MGGYRARLSVSAFDFVHALISYFDQAGFVSYIVWKQRYSSAGNYFDDAPLGAHGLGNSFGDPCSRGLRKR